MLARKTHRELIRRVGGRQRCFERDFTRLTIQEEGSDIFGGALHRVGDLVLKLKFERNRQST